MPRNRSSLALPAADLSSFQERLLSLVAHELGSLRAALDLRLDVLDDSLPRRDRDALHAISAQLRTLQHTARLLRAPSSGEGSLGEPRPVAASAWWAHLERLLAATLPPGIGVTATLPSHFMAPSDAWLFTMFALGVAGDITTLDMPSPAALACTLEAGDGSCLRMTLTPAVARPISRRWLRFAERLSAPGNAHLDSWRRVMSSALEWQVRVDLHGTQEAVSAQPDSPTSLT